MVVMFHNAFFLIAFFIWVAVETYVQLRDRKLLDKSTDNNTLKEVLMLSMVTLLLCLVVRLFFPRLYLVTLANEESVIWLGGILILVGTALRFWAVRTLGQFFRRTVMIQKEHKLIRKGPYKLLRHPSYTGAYLGIIGFSLATNNLLSLLVGLVLGFFSFWHRIRVEERVLSAHFGKKFDSYRDETKKLIPFIW